ncbi:MAG: 50S ribosomal protein L25/general stress protein Ctc [Actinomycetes bacterium]
MSEVRIDAEPRSEFGKGAARRVRRAGRVPAVLYGHGTAPRHLSMPAHELGLALKAANVLLELDFGGDRQLALPKSVQRDPIRGTVEHVDLVVVNRGERVTVDVHIVPVGELLPGGLLETVASTVSVEADSAAIPASLEIDVAQLAIGSSVHARDIVLPAGVNLAGDPDLVVLHMLISPTAAQLETSGSGEVAAGVDEIPV